MLTIFHAPGTRSSRVVWLAEEMGVAYDARPETLGKPSADFLTANPVGAFPAITDDGVAMGESVAIMQYMLERYGPSPLARRYGDPDYADYLEFLVFGEGSLAAFLNPMILTRFMAPGDRALATLELHNVEGKPGDYTASVTGRGGFIANIRQLFHLPLGQRTVQRVAPPALRARIPTRSRARRPGAR